MKDFDPPKISWVSERNAVLIKLIIKIQPPLKTHSSDISIQTFLKHFIFQNVFLPYSIILKTKPTALFDLLTGR